MKLQQPHSDLELSALEASVLDPVNRFGSDGDAALAKTLSDLPVVKSSPVQSGDENVRLLVHAPRICEPARMSIRARKNICPGATKTGTILTMAGKVYTFKEILDAAAKPYRELWHENGALNLGAVERHYAKRGHPLSQESLWRLYKGKQKAVTRAVEATHQVFKVPRAMLRGEAISGQMEKVLTDYKLSTLLLAERIEELDPAGYHQVAELVELLELKHKQLTEALASSDNVTPIGKKRR